MAVLSRRTFLAASAGLVVAAACGGDDAKSSEGGAGGATVLVSRFAPDAFTVGSQRVAVSLGNRDGLVSSGLPAALTASVRTEDATVVVPSVRAERHDKGLPVAYYPFGLTLAKPGTYELAVSSGGKALTQAFTVLEPARVAIPVVGKPLAPVDTPTTAAPHGVNPICTRKPACPLHSVSLRQALAAGKPVAYLIGTPAFCQTGVCGPILDFLLAARQRVGAKVVFVHAEVYTDDTAKVTTPAVNAYRMSFEPCLFVTDAKGVLRERLDVTFDGAEIEAALATVL
jgi:hypothetical protein